MIQKLQNTRRGFTLVEIMIVVAIIALLAAIAVPNFLRARKRSQATRMLEDLRMLNDAVDQYAIDTNKAAGQSYVWSDLKPYIKTGTVLYTSFAADGSTVTDMFGHSYWSTGVIDSQFPGDGDVSLDYGTYSALSDVAPMTFWSPYGVFSGPL